MLYALSDDEIPAQVYHSRGRSQRRMEGLLTMCGIAGILYKDTADSTSRSAAT